MAGVHAAVARRPWGVDLPDHRQTLEDTLLSYTRDAAYAEFREHEKGQVKTGMLADLTLWDRDLFAVPEDDIANVRAVLTLCDGRITYEA
jgi:hypothetical protein